MADPAQQFLDTQQYPDSLKADTWDAFHQAGSPQEFKSRFDKLSLPDEAKAHLWDMKFGTQPSAPTGSISPAPSRTLLQRGKDVLRNSPLGYSLEQTLPKVADALGMHPSMTTSNPEFEGAKTGSSGMISPAQLIDPNQPATPMGLVKSATRGALKGVGTLTRPDNAALALQGGPLMSNPLAQTLFGAQMVEGTATGLENAYKSAKSGQLNQAAEQAGGAALDFTFARSTLRHGAAEPLTEANSSPASERSAPADTQAPPPATEAAQRAAELKAKYEDFKASRPAAQSLSENGSPSEVQVPQTTQVGEQTALQPANTSAQSEVVDKSSPSPEADGKPVQASEGGKGLGPSGPFKAPENLSEAGTFSLRSKAAPTGPSTVDRLVNSLADRINDTPEEEDTKNILRRGEADLAQLRQQNYAKFADQMKAHRWDGPEELRNFMDAGEGKPGAKPLSPEDQATATAFHNEFQSRWKEVQDVLNRDSDSGIENYLKHLFVGPKNQSIAEKILFGKRNLQGPATFTKHRYYEFMSDGMDAGAEPVTYNPIEMQLLGLHEVDRFLMAHHMKNDLKDGGLIKWDNNAKNKLPSDWQPIDDKIFKPKVMQEGGGLTEYGKYYAPPEVAKLFNNYLSPGLRGDWRYDIIRHYGNSLNQIQLGFSAFHGTFATLVASMNDMSVGLQKAFNSKDIPGAAKMGLRSLVPGLSARMNYKLGKQFEQEFLKTGTHPELSGLVDAFKDAGGRVGMDPAYTNAAVQRFHRIWKSENKSWTTPFELTSAGLQSITEQIAKPIMKYYVPRLKLGAFAKMAENRIGELMKPGAPTNLDPATEMGKLWDSVDNRLGQLTYDNLFWHKKTKDLGMLSVRSLGWTLGSFREGFGALADTARGLNAIREGRRAELSTRMAFAISVPLVIGTTGAIAGYLMGHPPHEPIDYFFPQTGGTNDNGKPERLALPGYHKDAMNFHKHWAKTVVDKLHPMAQELTSIYQNHDFYDTEIRDTDASPLTQAWQIAKYLRNQAIPFGAANSWQRYKSGESIPSALGGFVGLNPATKEIGQTDAEELAYDNAKRHMEAGPHTPAQFEAQKTYATTRAQYASGRITEDDLSKMIDDGKMSAKQAAHIMQSVTQTPLERHASANHLDELMHVWDKATPSEKEVLKPILLKKAHTLSSYPADQQDALQQRLEKIFIDEEK